MLSKIAEVRFEGRKSLFHYDNPADHIQAFHLRGIFYELRQMENHRDIIPMKSTVLDIGSNVGNHTIFYAMHTWAGLVYPFEPNDHARQLLLSSINENSDYRARIKTDFIEYGIGRETSALHVIENQDNNLGGTSLSPSPISGANSSDNLVKCISLDQLTFEGRVSFLKIDVEGMELEVLAGATKLINRFRPSIAIEISHRHDASFWAWMQNNKYRVVNVFFEYLDFKNYVIIPENYE